MNREIKFRGQRLLSNEWVYGQFTIGMVNNCYISHFNGAIWNVKPETVGQYTGLKDKNGKEIYEGDILENDNDVKYIVVWMEQLGGFYLSIPNSKRGKEIISCAASKVANEPMLLFKEAVIGNIYESRKPLATQIEAWVKKYGLNQSIK